MIAPEKIEEVRLANDIVGVVSEYVALKRRGQNHFGLCPFHEENTPSFSVHGGRGIFRCFGCGRGGNVIGFLMEIERLSFLEAVKSLALRAHIELPSSSRAADDGPSEGEQLVEANQLARDFFHTQLLNASSAGAERAMTYLRQRGFTDDILRAYMVGYAPEGWEGLSERARHSRVPLDVFVKAGLLKIGQQAGRPYDVFRDRVMFPIRNLAGRVIAFGGRRLSEPAPGEPAAKYINSPETPVYTKGRELYGLWEARNDIRVQERAILVEGYTDAISLASAGVRAACASLGTALTEQQARLLLRFTPHVFILYDGDEAGQKASARAADVLLTCGAQPKILSLPEGEDPDSLVRARGAEAVEDLLNHALTIVEFHVERGLKAGHPPAQMARELIGSAAQIPSAIEREAFLQQVSARTGLSMTSLLSELAKERKPLARSAAPPARKAVWPQPGPETLLARALLRSPEIRDATFQRWSPEQVADEKLRRMLTEIHEQTARGEFHDPARLLSEFPEPPERDFIAEAIEFDEPEDDQRRIEIDRKTAADCLKALDAEKLRREISDVRRQVRLQPDNSDLLKTLHDLIRREKQLHAPETTASHPS